MNTQIKGTGRRKTSTARVYLEPGNGKITINGLELEKYFLVPEHKECVRKPLDVCDVLTHYSININVYGGGISSQSGACRHAISRALASIDPANQKTLKANGFLTRDSRMVERKKYGRRKARRRFQFSKR